MKVENATLKLLAEDKNGKYHSCQEELKDLRRDVKVKEDQVEKLEYQNAKLQDDFLV